MDNTEDSGFNSLDEKIGLSVIEKELLSGRLNVVAVLSVFVGEAKFGHDMVDNSLNDFKSGGVVGISEGKFTSVEGSSLTFLVDQNDVRNFEDFVRQLKKDKVILKKFLPDWPYWLQ